MNTSSNEQLNTISFIIPIYNVESYLEKCLKSIEGQTSDRWEVILVDDGSTDQSPTICQKFTSKNSKFTYVRQVNRGQGSARNQGILLASGEFICFVDPDDWIKPDTVKDLIPLMNKGNPDFVNFGIEFLTANGKVVRKFCNFSQRSLRGDEIFKRAMLDRDVHSTPCNKIYRTQFLREHQIFFPSLRAYEDLYFSRVLASHSRHCDFTEKIYYQALIRPGSTTRSMNSEKISQSLELLKLEKSKFIGPHATQAEVHLFNAHALKFITQILIQAAFGIKSWKEYSICHKILSNSDLMGFKINSAVLHHLNNKNVLMAIIARNRLLLRLISIILSTAGVRPY